MKNAYFLYDLVIISVIDAQANQIKGNRLTMIASSRRESMVKRKGYN